MQLKLHVNLQDNIPNISTYNTIESTYLVYLRDIIGNMSTYNTTESSCPSARQHWHHVHLQYNWIYNYVDP